MPGSTGPAPMGYGAGGYPGQQGQSYGPSQPYQGQSGPPPSQGSSMYPNLVGSAMAGRQGYTTSSQPPTEAMAKMSIKKIQVGDHKFLALAFIFLIV